MKKKTLDNLISIGIVTFIVLAICVGIWNTFKLVATERKLDDCQKQYPWWEMVRENCGYDEEKDQKNDYCRGFRNGYDYRAQQQKIDIEIRTQYENE